MASWFLALGTTAGTRGLEINGTHIDDTFAEAFGMRYVRLLITAADDYWLDAALRELCGYSNIRLSSF